MAKGVKWRGKVKPLGKTQSAELTEPTNCKCNGQLHSWSRRCKERRGRSTDEAPRDIGCCMKGPAPNEDDAGEKAESRQKQLNEVNKGRKDPGRWELFTITVDSGAGESVSPPNEGTSFPIIETQASRDGTYYVAATGDRVYNEGERRITCTTPEGHQQSWMFQVAEVNKARASVSRICESGRERVIFQKGNSFIENIKSGRRTKLLERNGVYVLEAWIDKQAGFARQGAP